MAKAGEWSFTFHLLWRGPERQPFAERLAFTDAGSARRAHTEALTFRWATAQLDPAVSDLYASTGDREQSIADGRSRDVAETPDPRWARNAP